MVRYLMRKSNSRLLALREMRYGVFRDMEPLCIGGASGCPLFFRIPVRLNFLVAWALGSLLSAWTAYAIAPHEIAVLINKNDASSLEVANHFVHDRQIPPQNVVTLALPNDRDIVTITPGEFEEWIWKPAVKQLEGRGVQDHILAWVYSSGFPTTISTNPEMSICGLTFVRNQLPDPGTIDGGLRSPLFAGPIHREGDKKSSQSFDRFAVELDEGAMPLPSMMLGYTWARGNSTAVVVDVIKRGVRSDFTRPKGNVYFYFRDDIRFEARLWQMLEVRNELLNMGVITKVANNLPDRATDRIFGLMTGTQYLEMGNVSNILPGAYCDHLTSFAARYQTHLQMKTSAWFDAGATLSSGTVTEPYATWMKFPHARFYVHYANGCSAIESLYQSVLAPTQLLLLGEPLARPYGWPFKLQAVVDGRTIRASAEGIPPGTRLIYTLLVNGRIRKNFAVNPEFKLDDDWLEPGWNEVRVVGVTDGAVGHVEQAIIGLHNGDVKVAINPGERVSVHVVEGGVPEKVRLVKNEEPFITVKGDAEVSFSLEADLVGRGPSVLFAEALVDDKWVRSKPLVR